MTVTPSGVEDVDPPTAVISLVVVDPDEADVRSAEAIWGTFCHYIYFFASFDEGEK
jgi:hypothetical protein